MSSSGKTQSHAYIQYLLDREKEIVSTSQILNGNAIARGKIVQLNWHNEQSGKTEVYEAYIHFLGTCELDVERQVDAALESGQRLSLPSQKFLERDTFPDLPEEVKAKKTKMDLTKNITNKSILAKKAENSEFIKSRQPLSLDEDEITEDTSTVSNGTQNSFDNEDSEPEEQETRRNSNEQDSSKRKERQQDSPKLTGSEQNSSRYKDRENDSPTHKKKPATPTCIGSKQNLMELVTNKPNNENMNPGLTKSKEVEKTSSVSLKKYDQIYLGEGIFLETQKWRCINDILSHGSMGRRRTAEMVKTVRRTLTHKANDLNKKTTPKKRGDSDSESEEEPRVLGV